jgi:hypothetical protein
MAFEPFEVLGVDIVAEGKVLNEFREEVVVQVQVVGRVRVRVRVERVDSLRAT